MAAGGGHLSSCYVAARRQACGREGVSKLPHSKGRSTARLLGHGESRRSFPRALRALWSAAATTPRWLSEIDPRAGPWTVPLLLGQSGVAAALCHRTPKGIMRRLLCFPSPRLGALYVQCRVFGAQPRAVVEVFFLVLFLLWRAVEKWITSPFGGGSSRCFPARPRGRIGQEAEAFCAWGTL